MTSIVKWPPHVAVVGAARRGGWLYIGGMLRARRPAPVRKFLAEPAVFLFRERLAERLFFWGHLCKSKNLCASKRPRNLRPGGGGRRGLWFCVEKPRTPEIDIARLLRPRLPILPSATAASVLQNGVDRTRKQFANGPPIDAPYKAPSSTSPHRAICGAREAMSGLVRSGHRPASPRVHRKILPRLFERSRRVLRISYNLSTASLDQA